MFEYFEGNYTWSSAFMMGLMAGGQFGEMHRHLKGLRGKEPNPKDWQDAWGAAAKQQEDLAVEDLMDGYPRSAGNRYLRAAAYRLCGERQMPLGEAKMEEYRKALQSFDAAIKHRPLPLEPVVVESPDGPLPGYFLPAEGGGKAPVVIFYSGLDVVKELLYCFIREELSIRGISCVIMDSPGVGEPLRVRNVPSRPDYEVTTKAVIDYLVTRIDVDPARIGMLGISLGGYYAMRSAAYEPRIKACVAWGGVWDYGALWKKRFETASKNISVPQFQLQWIMGTETMEKAVERVQQWDQSHVMQNLTQPLLILHGAHDKAIPVDHAQKAFDAAGSIDKRLRIFTEEEGGAEHVQADEPDAARQLLADWFEEHL